MGIIKIVNLKVFRFTIHDAVCEQLFMRADSDIRNQTYVGVVAKL